MKKIRVGFVGQGYVGKAYADNFEQRGFSIVRYAKEKEYIGNRDQIKTCDVVFIAVPTPTTKKGFDLSIVSEAVSLVAPGKTAVIKSTILPGSVETIQKKFPKVYVCHSPEFLREKTAARDVAMPERNIIGVARKTPAFIKKAKEVMSILPRAPFERIILAKDAELIKYAGNCFLYVKVVYANMLFDLCKAVGADWKVVAESLGSDSRIGKSHLAVHFDKGRGAGGHCFIKDFAAFEAFYRKARSKDKKGNEVLNALSQKNIELLTSSKKDLDLLRGVYR